MAALTAQLNKTPVLPPIIGENDRRFLKSIERYIAEETQQLECNEERNVENLYEIYRNVFDKVIEYVTSYRNILTSIKQEYEQFIDIIKRGQKDAFYLQGKLQVLTSEPTTLMHYQRRAFRLQEKIEIIENDSMKILKQIQDRTVPIKVPIAPVKKFTRVLESKISVETIKPTTRIPGMTIKESFDMDALAKYRLQLEMKLVQLEEDIRTKFVPAQVKVDLEQALEIELNNGVEAVSEKKRLKLRYKRNQIIAAAITSWNKSDKTIKLRQFLYKIIRTEMSRKEVPDDDQVAPKLFEDDDPSSINETTDLLEYIKRFNELIDKGKYEAASVYVSNCPRAVLRNMDTMEQFKAAPVVEGKVPPLMLFFEALINSSSATEDPVSASLTLEGIKCALMQKRLDLVVHWITQQRITFSEALGDAIFEYGKTERHNRARCLALAQIVYRQCAVHRKAVLCMCLEGQVSGVMEFIYNCKEFSLDDLLFLLKKCRSNELIQYLIHEWKGKPALLSVGQAVLSLMYTDHKENGFQILEHINASQEGELEKVILSDKVCTPEAWAEIADECSNHGYFPLSIKIRSILTAQDGVVEVPAHDEDQEIMEHVFL